MEAGASLLDYLEDRYANDAPLEPNRVAELLANAAGQIDMSMQAEDELPLLHLVGMNEASEPEALQQIVQLLLEAGASPDQKDGDGDAVLEAILSIAEELQRDNEDLDPRVKQGQMAMVVVLIRWPGMNVTSEQVKGTCAWLRRYNWPEEGRRGEAELLQVEEVCAWLRQHKSPLGQGCAGVLQALSEKVGAQAVNQAWCSEEMLAYLEHCAYEDKMGLQASRIEKYIRNGASPAHSQNGATAMLLAVLNPYSSYTELARVFRLMLEVEPAAATIRDGFKLSPLQWAADYASISQQHGLQKANPAVLLALFPQVVELLPAELDASEVCLKAAPGARCSVRPQANANGSVNLRFMEGDRALCRVSAVGAVDGTSWEEGTIVGCWYREVGWPVEFPGAPYLVTLDLGQQVFAFADSDRLIRPLRPKADAAANTPTMPIAAKVGATLPSAAAEAVLPTVPANGKPAQQKRFIKRQTEDGKWEIVDTKSGRARPSSPPDSDDEDA